MSKELQKIFLAAAEVYANPRHESAQGGCCYAIGSIEGQELDGDYDCETPAQKMFVGLYKADSGSSVYYWAWPSIYTTRRDYLAFEKDRKARVLALLFAAEVARTGL